MEVFDYKGICLKRDKRAIYLDPSSGRPDGAVSHGHSDHLRPKTHMTEPTKEVMIARTGSKEATTHKFHEKFKINDFELEFVSAGQDYFVTLGVTVVVIIIFIRIAQSM